MDYEICGAKEQSFDSKGLKLPLVHRHWPKIWLDSPSGGDEVPNDWDVGVLGLVCNPAEAHDPTRGSFRSRNLLLGSAVMHPYLTGSALTPHYSLARKSA